MERGELRLAAEQWRSSHFLSMRQRPAAGGPQVSADVPLDYTDARAVEASGCPRLRARTITAWIPRGIASPRSTQPGQ